MLIALELNELDTWKCMLHIAVSVKRWGNQAPVSPFLRFAQHCLIFDMIRHLFPGLNRHAEREIHVWISRNTIRSAVLANKKRKNTPDRRDPRNFSIYPLNPILIAPFEWRRPNEDGFVINFGKERRADGKQAVPDQIITRNWVGDLNVI